MPHQYVRRTTGEIVTETFRGDAAVRHLYGLARERTPAVFRALTRARASQLLAWWNFDAWLGARLSGSAAFLERQGLALDEAVDPEALRTWRQVFERQIRYWEVRPLPRDEAIVVAPADSKALVLTPGDDEPLFVKEKFFSRTELMGAQLADRLRGGPVAIFRLTPELYHYTHAPVSGLVLQRFLIDGAFHSCHPEALVVEVTSLSKNRRVVTVIDTDVAGGTGVGLAVMIEIVALMVGDLVSCSSRHRYEHPRPLVAGAWVERGAPLSLFRPGSSTVVLVFEPGRVRFDADLLANLQRSDVDSRFTRGFGTRLVETELRVRESLGRSTQGARPVPQEPGAP
jgi:phosphatidylserine decarboxylase